MALANISDIAAEYSGAVMTQSPYYNAADFISGAGGSPAISTATQAAEQAAYAAMPPSIATGEPTIMQSGVGAAAPAVIAGLGALGVSMPAWLTALLGGLGAAYGGAQALGLGQGGGLFDNNLLGGDNITVGGVVMGGPGLPEPAAKYVLKEWHVNYSWGKLQYYMVKMPGQSRKIAMWNSRTGKWKVWTFRTPRLAVIGKNMPRHQMIVRLRKNLSKHRADADTILKLTSPNYAAYKHRKRSRR